MKVPAINTRSCAQARVVAHETRRLFQVFQEFAGFYFPKTSSSTRFRVTDSSTMTIGYMRSLHSTRRAEMTFIIYQGSLTATLHNKFHSLFHRHSHRVVRSPFSNNYSVNCCFPVTFHCDTVGTYCGSNRYFPLSHIQVLADARKESALSTLTADISLNVPNPTNRARFVGTFLCGIPC